MTERNSGHFTQETEARSLVPKQEIPNSSFSDVLPRELVLVGNVQREPVLCSFSEYYLREGIRKQDKNGCANLRVLGEKTNDPKFVRIGSRSVGLKEMGLTVITKNWMNIEEKYKTGYFGKEAVLVIGSSDKKYEDLTGWWMIPDSADKKVLVPDRFFWSRIEDFDHNGQSVRGVAHTLPIVADFLESKGVSESMILGFGEKVSTNALKTEAVIKKLEEEVKNYQPGGAFGDNDHISASGSLNSLYWLTLRYLETLRSGNDPEEFRDVFVNKFANLTDKISDREKNAIRLIRHNQIKEDYLSVWTEGEVINVPGLLVQMFVSSIALQPGEMIGVI